LRAGCGAVWRGVRLRSSKTGFFGLQGGASAAIVA